MLNTLEQVLEAALADRFEIGQILVRKISSERFVLSHREDKPLGRVETFHDPQAAIELAKFDDAGNYRPLKTAPNLRHGWRLELSTLPTVRGALDHFYPGRLAVFAAWQAKLMQTTPLRETLDRQSGMYRVAAQISDEQLDQLVGNFCRSDGGCLRTILWKRDASGAGPSKQLPPGKFDPVFDQMKALGGPASAIPATVVPLLCQEACNLLVAECRKVVKTEGAAPSAP